MKEGIAEIDESDDPIIKEDESDKNESQEGEEPTPADEEDLLKGKLEYKRLLELQGQLIDGVSKMTPILKEAKEAFENIKNMN